MTVTGRTIQLECEVSGDFWAAWKDFEVRHGNEDTIREMLRIKRSIQALYNTQFTANLISQQTAQSLSDSINAENINIGGSDPMANLAQQQLQGPPKRAGDVSFVRGETLLQPLAVSDKTENPDEIKLDDDEDEEDEDNPKDDMEVENVHIPAEVFGSLKRPEDNAEQDE